MRFNTISLIFLSVLMLSACHNSVKTNKTNPVIDSLKTRLEQFSGNDYNAEVKCAKKGMSLSQDSTDYYYFLTYIASVKMLANDTPSKDSLVLKIKKYIETAHSSKRLNDLIARFYFLAGNYAIINHHADSSIVYYKQALAYQRKGSRMDNQAIILTCLSDGYIEKADYANGASCLRKALFLSDSLNNTDAKIQAVCGLAKTYVGLRNFKEAGKYIRQGYLLLPKMLGHQKFFFYNTLGNFYYYQEDYASSLRIFKMLNSQMGNLGLALYDQNLTWINLADAYIKVGELDSARVYQNKCRGFFEKNKVEAALYYLETQDIAILLKEGSLKQVRRMLTLKRDDRAVGYDLVSIRHKYLMDYYTRIGDYGKAYHYLKQFSHDNDSVRNEKQNLATAETAFRYEQDSKALKLELNLSKSEEHLRTSELFLVVAALIIIILIAIFIAVSSHNRRRRLKMLNLEKERVMKLRMEELRNRVSPHFIFNVLNYELYNRQQGKETTDIPRLVTMLRSGLEESDQLCVTLSKELDFVDGYVELQSKGMDNFVYNMNISEDVDIDNVQIPSMIIQIAVENAIKHGLRGLEREKVLDITIKKNVNATCVTVTDNGRGLGAKDDHSQGTGTGMKVIRETLEMLNNRNCNDIIYEMKNNPHGSGCRVDIIIPDEYNYSLG